MDTISKYRPFFVRVLLGPAEDEAMDEVGDSLIPEDLICPVSGAMLSQPVRFLEGPAMSRASFNSWRQQHPRLHPYTGRPLSLAPAINAALGEEATTYLDFTFLGDPLRAVVLAGAQAEHIVPDGSFVIMVKLPSFADHGLAQQLSMCVAPTTTVRHVLFAVVQHLAGRRCHFDLLKNSNGRPLRLAATMQECGITPSATLLARVNPSKHQLVALHVAGSVDVHMLVPQTATVEEAAAASAAWTR